MASNERKSFIVTFKPKDQRQDTKKDKVEILRSVVKADLHPIDTANLPPGGGLPAGVPPESLVLDINTYEAPIVTVFLTSKEAAALRSNPNVETVEEDGEFRALGFGPRLSELQVEGHPSPLIETIPAGVAQIKAPAAWDSTRGKGVKVAVLDSGIDFIHPDLAANYKGGVSFVKEEPTPMDGNGHGTHCAGTIAAAMNGAGIVGVAPAAYLYAVKVVSSSLRGEWSWLISGINWCIANGIKVLNMSLGNANPPKALERMCHTAWNRGLLLVAAAGNGDSTPDSILFPAKYSTVIAVSAIDSANVITTGSSRGSEIELCAPGVNVLSTSPGGSYATGGGTSAACPHVSGAAALAWGSHRYQTNGVIRRLLAWTADNLGVPGRDPLYGYGRVDAEQAAFEFTVPPPNPGIP
ncbi:MAG: S8 family peptidase [Acidobacteriota bacterium]